jgi:DNA damage-binding protein 2
VDVLDASAGNASSNPTSIITQLADPVLTTICPLNIVHPVLDVVASGSSRALYVWRPRVTDTSAVDDESDGEPDGSRGLGPVARRTSMTGAANRSREGDDDNDGDAQPSSKKTPAKPRK